MCGIFGFTQFTNDNKLMFPILATEMETRGSTSWGASNGDKWAKVMGSINRTLDPTVLRWDSSRGIIFHTRTPSSGTGRSAEEAHPFIFNRLLEPSTDTQPYAKYRQVVGIHNGCIGNHTQLKSKYEDRKDFNVDSMHIFKAICDDESTEEIYGTGAIAWYVTEYWVLPENVSTELPPPSQPVTKLYIARFNTEALHIGRLPDKSIVFASTKSAIEKAAVLAGVTDVEYSTIKPETKYEITLGPDPMVVEIADIKFGSYSYSSTEGVVNGRYVAPNFFHGQRAGGGDSQNANASNYAGPNENYHSYRQTSGNTAANGNPLKFIDFDTCPSCLTKIDPLFEIVCQACFEAWAGTPDPLEKPKPNSPDLSNHAYVN